MLEVRDKHKMLKQEKQWITTWSYAQRGVGSDTPKARERMMTYQVKSQHHGDKIRLTLANAYTDKTQKISYLAIATEQDKTFEIVSVAGKPVINLLPNEIQQTDDINKTVRRGDILYIKIVYDTQITQGCTLLAGIDVHIDTKAATIVAFGDSITEQSYFVTPLAQAVYERLGDNFSLVNAGISGNRLLKGFSTVPVTWQYFGLSGVERFERDVFAVNSNVKAVIIALGVNDLHQPGTDPLIPVDEIPTFDEMVAGYERLFYLAHQHHCKVYVATITPFIGFTVDVKNAEKESLRNRLNDWLLKHAKVTGVYDFNGVLASKHDPTRLSSQYDSGDMLHPSEYGGLAMSQIIDVKMLGDSLLVD